MTILLLSLATSTAGYAGADIAAGEVTMIRLWETHTGILIKQPGLVDPDGCGRSDYFILPNSHPHYQEAYSLLLSAYSMGKKVSVYISGCHQGIPAIKHLTLVKQ